MPSNQSVVPLAHLELTQLGRPPANGRKAADIYAGLLAADPHATAERRSELRLEATRRARQGPLFFDLTISLSKGEPEQMMDAAPADYIALTADGTDVLLMAADHTLRRELSRRIRDDLISLDLVQGGPTVRIADGGQASPGDLIVCTRNDHSVEAGEPGRTLANGDLLRIEAVNPGGLVVRRALDPEPRTGRRRWTERNFLYSHFGDAELGYAVTDHVAQGRTVHTGLAVITGTEDRQRAYVALSRGTDMNMAYVFTLSPKRADPAPGPRPAPELARYDRITAERAAQPDAAAAGTRDALAVLSGVLDRDGQQFSASQTRHRALADADHLAILHAIWTDQTTPARAQCYRDLLLASLPPDYRREPGHQARWLWRTLRAVELAGLDAAQVLDAAIGERDLAGARDPAAVIDARLRCRIGAVVPTLAGPWSAQVPAIADPERRAYAAQIAAMMDARKDRIGEYAAEHAPPWAVAALGPVPEDSPDRLDWQKRAASIGAWRELSGHRDPADPIGPEPVAAAPDLRAAWHEALTALAPAGGNRTIAPMGHLKMLGSVQPFLSGGASKTINLPNDATIEDIEKIYLEAWRLGVKSVALYRDGCKASQPYETSKRAATGPVGALKPTRERLPDERDAITHHFSVGGHDGYVTVGLYPDGRPGELFFRVTKEGSTVNGLMDSLGISMSMALQHGVPLKDLVRKLAHLRFEPAGATNNPKIRFAKSIPDYVARWLAIEFLTEDERRSIGLEGPAEGNGHGNGNGGPAKAGSTASPSTFQTRPLDSFSPPVELHLTDEDAPSCAVCGGIMVRSGTCYACTVCGSTSGCS